MRVTRVTNEVKLAASFCQVAAWVPGYILHFYMMKNHKIASNSATTEVGQNNAPIWRP
jgi:hypothetical protein